MTTPRTTQRQDSSLTRDVLYAARYYLWRPRVLLTLAAIAIVAGLAFNWSWLVAAGLAPILISTLPCLIMCAFGVCMMCRSGKKDSAPIRDAAETAAPPTTLAVSATDKPSTGVVSLPNAPDSIGASAPPQLLESNPPAAGAGCCQSSTDQIKPERMIEIQPNRERRDTRA
jgi:hypothetical protein